MLTAAGMGIPTVHRGDRFVSGMDLKSVAELVGVEYEEREMLPPGELVRRIDIVMSALARYLLQVTPEGLQMKSPDRDRSLKDLGYHAGHVAHAFLHAYETDEFDASRFYGNAPEGVETSQDLAAHALATSDAVLQWWENAGQYDPLDRVVETYWGARTLHEVLEREAWHGAQHTRQVMMFLEKLNLTPNVPLTAEDLAGLPIPEGVWN